MELLKFKPKMKDVIVLLIFVAVIIGISGFVGRFASDSTSLWYQELAKSSLTPPSWVFGVVWSSLYFLMSISAWLVWRKSESEEARFALILFGVHLIYNWAWSFIFFQMHLLFVSFIWITGMIAIVGILMFFFYRVSKTAAFLLLPYFVWISFAAYLSFFIWQHN